MIEIEVRKLRLWMSKLDAIYAIQCKIRYFNIKGALPRKDKCAICERYGIAYPMAYDIGRGVAEIEYYCRNHSRELNLRRYSSAEINAYRKQKAKNGRKP